MIIERPAELRKIKDAKKWLLVFGRRKTGKSFLVEKYVPYDEYFFVKRDRTVLSKKDGGTMDYDAFMEVFKRALKDNKLIVIDEFHRLGDGFFDYVHFTEKEGKLILISSTLFLSKKLLAERSPLLGFFAEVPISLISLSDCLSALKKYPLTNKELLEYAILLREPIAIEYFDMDKKPRKLFGEILAASIKTIPALVGEIFIEEERSISIIYEGILRAIAAGKVVSSEISSYLFARKLIKKDDPSIIQQYLVNLIEFGLIRRISVHEKKRFIYKHVSPLVRIFYYADEKYNISERAFTDKEMESIIGKLIPRIIEDEIREFFAWKLGLKEAIIEAKDYDIDACFISFQKPSCVMEIKWKEKIPNEDVIKAEENLSRINAKRRILFVPNKGLLHSSILEILDVSDL